MSSVHLSAFPPVTQVITSANENMITIHTFKIYYRAGFCCPIGSDQGLLFGSYCSPPHYLLLSPPDLLLSPPLTKYSMVLSTSF